MQKLIPHLWYNDNAREAATWYVSLFENSGIDQTTVIYDTPSGDAELVDFHLANFHISSISAGPFFQFNPSLSFMVSCVDSSEVQRLYTAFSEGGTVLMPLDSYSFSPQYAWVQDRYGLSWQLIQDENLTEKTYIRPTLLFSGNSCGKALDAMDYYAKVFPNSSKGYVHHYGDGEAEDSRAKINYGELTLMGTPWVVMDNNFGGDYDFDEAFSFIIQCEHQGEVDDYWELLSFDPESEQCGWLKDQFNLSWQVTPRSISTMMATATEEEMRRLTKAFLPMKKLDIHLIEAAKNNLKIPDPIIVTTDIPSDINTVWSCWTESEHITGWYFASNDWHSPSASNDLRPGGTFVTRMESKDGSVGFDFSGIYDCRPPSLHRI